MWVTNGRYGQIFLLLAKTDPKASPAHRMAGIRSALLMIHGANDPRVPMRETESIVERARSSGQPVWTLYASNEGHGFTRLENIAYENAVVAVFLRRFL